MNKNELFAQTCEFAHKAAAQLADMVDLTANNLKREEITQVKQDLQRALCAATSLESILAGNIPPKLG